MTHRYLGLCLLAFAVQAQAAPQSEARPASYRDVLHATLDVHDQLRQQRGQAPAAASQSLRTMLNSKRDEAFWAKLDQRHPASSELVARLTRQRDALRAAPAPTSIAKIIAFPEPTPMSRCVDASAATARAMLEAWSASAEALAAAKWACLQTEAGENTAFLCTALAIETEALQTELDQESFCLGDQRDATIAALAQTQSNVVDHLNQRVDVAVTSRATQVSLDAVQDTLDTLLARLTDLRNAVNRDDLLTTAQLTDLLADAAGLAAQLSALSADVHDIRFRIQAVQVDVEDLQDRLADVQAVNARLAQLSEQIRLRLNSARDGVNRARSAADTSASEQLDRKLAIALGAPNQPVLRYRLPAAQGGELERSREILIRAISAYEANAINTSAARAKLVLGDQAYNLGRPLEAYDAYAQAYRLLTLAGAPPSAMLMRNSFE